MRTQRQLGMLVLGMIAMAWMAPGRAEAGTLSPGDGDPWVFNFDENGNGMINVNGTGFTPLIGTLMADPSNGNALALTYLLPSVVGNGDVLVYENAAETMLGDDIRFTDAQGNLTGSTADRMIFYSLPGGGALADTGLPASVGTGATGGPVVENANGMFTYSGVNVYNGDSPDATATPEPASLTILGIGIASLAGYAWRRRKPALPC